MNVFFDIETIPEQSEEAAKRAISDSISAPASMKKPETISDWHNGAGKYAGEKESAIESAYRATSFDGARGQVCSIAYAVGDGELVSSTDVKCGSEKGLLEWFVKSLTEKVGKNGKRPCFFIGHFIGGFDLKFLFHRLVVSGIDPGFELPFNGRHGQHFFDTMIAWAGYKNRISQDDLCKALGMEGKPNGIDGSLVWDFYKSGRIAEIEEYNSDDVAKVREIYQRLTFRSVALAGSAPQKSAQNTTLDSEAQAAADQVTQAHEEDFHEAPANPLADIPVKSGSQVKAETTAKTLAGDLCRYCRDKGLTPSDAQELMALVEKYTNLDAKAA